MHFIAQIQYYITFEVLQCSWADFQEEYRRVQDFDQLLLAHEDFLKKLTESCLLTEKSSYIATSIRSTFNSVSISWLSVSMTLIKQNLNPSNQNLD